MKKILIPFVAIILLFSACASNPASSNKTSAKRTPMNAEKYKALLKQDVILRQDSYDLEMSYSVGSVDKMQENLIAYREIYEAIETDRTDFTGMIINDSDTEAHFYFQSMAWDKIKKEEIHKDRFFLLTDVKPHETVYFKIPDSIIIGDTGFIIYAWDSAYKKYVPVDGCDNLLIKTHSMEFTYDGIIHDKREWGGRATSVDPYKVRFVKAFEVETDLKPFTFDKQ